MKRCLVITIFASLLLATGCSMTTHQTSLSSILGKIQVAGPSASIIVGQTEQMTATGLYAGGNSQDLTNSVTWSSSDTTVASVAATGMLTAKKSGTAVISATLQGISGTFNISVAPALVSIAVTPASPTIARQTTIQFMAIGTYTDNSTQNLTSSVSWSSSDTSVATISSTAPTMGLARAVSSGSTMITATSGSITGSTSLTVSTASVTSLAVTPVNPTLALGLSQQFTATAGFSDGSKQDVTGVTQWQSSSTNVASITTSGLATAKNIGTSTITGTFGGVSSTSVVTVNAANLNSIAIQPATPSIAAGTRTQLAAIGTFNDGSTRDITFLVTWTSSNTSIATVSAGIASAVSPGQITVTATLGGVTGGTLLTVTNATIVSISISPAGVTIPTGGYQKFTASGTFSDSSTQDITEQVTWSSNSTAIATVSNTAGNHGFAVGVSAGTATISAAFSFGGASATGTTGLTVSSATLSSLTLTPTTAEIAPASGLQFTALGTFTDGTKENRNAFATWTSSNTSVAGISQTGFATGQSAGAVTITAQEGSLSATASLLVESATLTSIQVTPQNARVAAGFDTPMKAVGTFSNGDTQDLTAFVTWTSSNPSAATIANGQVNAGLLSAIALGNTTITAVFAGQVGTTSITVTNATLTGLAITPSSASIPVGQTQQFDAVGSFTDGSTLDLSRQVTWSSSDAGVATINSIGLATAASSGTSTISAELEGVTATAILTVQ